jgi:predicted TIM-barrel fold metal-dependent hydrolase
MRTPYPLKIDAYSHIAPTRYRKALEKVSPKSAAYMIDPFPPLHDLDSRFRIMDRYEGLVQVIAPAWPSVEAVADRRKARDLARLANDEMAAVVAKYPDRFVAAVGCLPMNDVEAALKEADRVVEELHFRGVLVYTPIKDKPLDLPEFMPLYEKMAAFNLPILIHPMRNSEYADYRTEEASKYRVYMLFGWVYETTVAMTRLVFSGVFDRYPGLKFLTHHCGAMVPYLQERIKQFLDVGQMRRRGEVPRLPKAPIDYYRMFYNDTAIYGNPEGLECARAFCGVDRLLFAADFPLGDMEFGNRNYRQTINAIERMDLTDEDRKKIYEDNARNLMLLPI